MRWRWRSTSPCAFLNRHHHPLPQPLQLNCLGCHIAGGEVALGRFFGTLLHDLIQELLKPWPKLTALAKGQRLHSAELVELPLPRPHCRRSHSEHLLIELRCLLLYLQRDCTSCFCTPSLPLRCSWRGGR
jgi:hypothetical protein